MRRVKAEIGEASDAIRSLARKVRRREQPAQLSIRRERRKTEKAEERPYIAPALPPRETC